MEYTTSNNNQQIRVNMSGRFTFGDNQKFKSILDTVRNGPSPETIDIDMNRLEFVDSAALGMLLLLKDECGIRNISLTLHGPRGQVEKMFEISRFETIFTILD